MPNIHTPTWELVDRHTLSLMRLRAMEQIAVPLDNGFRIPNAGGLCIKNVDEEGEYTLLEAKKEFGKLIPPRRLIESVLRSVHALESLAKQLDYFIPYGAFPDDEYMMSFLGLRNHIFRGEGLLERSVYVRPMIPGGYTLTYPELTTKHKVRLLLKR